MTKRSTQLVLCAVAMALLCACPTDYPPPTDIVSDGGELLSGVQSATLDLPDARFKEVRLDYFGEKGRLSVKQLVLVAHPDRVRIQTYIPGFEGVAGVLACACGRFAYHDRRENVYYYGPSTAQNVARVLPVGLSCRDLVHVMMGGAPHERLAQAGGTVVSQWDRTTGRYAVSLTGVHGVDAGARFDLQIRHGDWRVAEMIVGDGEGGVRYRYTADHFEKTDGRVLPARRRFVVPASDEDFSLTVGQTQIDPELPEVVWQLAPPGGTPVRYIGPSLSPAPPAADGDLCQADAEGGE